MATNNQIIPTITDAADDKPRNKFHIEDRLDKALLHGHPMKNNRSSDITPLTKKFDAMRKKLHSLMKAAKEYSKSRGTYDKSRVDFASKMAALAIDSPLEGPTSTNDDISFLKFYKSATNQSKIDLEKFQNDVIDYVIEWERVITKRVNTDMKEESHLHQRFDHYKHKVENLRKKIMKNEEQAAAMEAGNNKPSLMQAMSQKFTHSTPDKMNDKLERNEMKLDTAWKAHEKKATQLCLLLEEVTERGWKDLFPLVQSTMAWEVQRAAHDADIFVKVPQIVDAMNATFAKFDIPVDISSTDSVVMPLATTTTFDDKEHAHLYLTSDDDDSTFENDEFSVSSPQQSNSDTKTENLELSPTSTVTDAKLQEV